MRIGVVSMQLFEVFLWPKWAPFGVPTLIPSHECIHAVSAFAAVEKAMRARKLSVVGHAVAEIVRGGSCIIGRMVCDCREYVLQRN